MENYVIELTPKSTVVPSDEELDTMYFESLCNDYEDGVISLDEVILTLENQNVSPEDIYEARRLLTEDDEDVL